VASSNSTLLDGIEMPIESRLESYAAGSEVPWVILHGDRILGAITLTGIVLGPFRSAHVGYWVDHQYSGRGIGSAALTNVLILEIAGSWQDHYLYQRILY
jgi:RimJ/RimL family protein N-acetyltransferase